MTRLLLCTATILALTASANAQGYFGGSWWYGALPRCDAEPWAVSGYQPRLSDGSHLRARSGLSDTEAGATATNQAAAALNAPITKD